MKDWWVLGAFFCCWVRTDDNNIITDCAPILNKFIGQPFAHLEEWKAFRKKELIERKR